MHKTAQAMTSRCQGFLAALAFIFCPGVAGNGFCHMLYINADTNLERYQVNDMEEVLKIPKDPTFTALMYMDRNDASTSNTGSAMPNLFYSNGQLTTKEISTAIYAKLGVPPGHSSNAWIIQQNNHQELDTTSKPTVLDFVRWAWGICSPSQWKVLSFNMHGGGVGGISGDDSNGHSSLSIPELKSIFTTLNNEGKRFSLIGFDTCLMSAYSLAQVLYPLADYLVASEPTEPGYGWDYTKINTRATTALQYGQSIVNAFLNQRQGPNQLVLTDLHKFGQVVQPWHTLMSKMKNGLNHGDQNLVDSITRARESSAEYDAVWEVFVDWFNIKDSSGAQEKSQMDLGSFWRHLAVQCPALKADIAPLLKLLEASIVYKKNYLHQAECSGPGCAAGAEGLALWFKKRRWMLGAYENQANEMHMSVEQFTDRYGAFVDGRLEKEIKEGLPDWYQFLRSFYTFKPASTGVKTCQGTGAGHQSNPSYNQMGNTPPCPPGGHTCTLNVHCGCPSTGTYTHQQAFRTPQGQICYGCMPPQGKHPGCAYEDCSWTTSWSCPGKPRGTEGVAGNDGSMGYRCCCGDLSGGRRLENFTALPIIELADEEGFTGEDLAPVAGEAEFPAAQYICEDDNAFCQITVDHKKESGGDTLINGQIADWVTSIDFYVGTDSSDNGLNDVSWTMALPVTFDTRTTFALRWVSVIPYVTTTNDECQAFMRIDGAVDAFNEPAQCAYANVTLQAPVHYYATEAALQSNTYENAYLEQVVACATLVGTGPARLKISSNDKQVFHFVDHDDGGYIQPLINHGSTPDFEDAQMQPCRSEAPMPWVAGPTINLVDIDGHKMRSNVDRVYGVLVSNPPVASDGTGASHRGNETFVIDVASGDLTRGIESNGEESGSSFNWWYVIIPCICCLLLAGAGLLYQYMSKDKKAAPKKKKRAVETSKSAPAPVPTAVMTPPEAAATSVLTAPPVYLAPQATYKALRAMPAAQAYAQPIQSTQAMPLVQSVQTSMQPVVTSMPGAASSVAAPTYVTTATPTYQQAAQPYQQVLTR